MTTPNSLSKKQRRQIELLCKEHKQHDARALLIQFCQQNPANIDAWFLLGEISEQLADYNNAISCFTKVIQLDANNSMARKRLACIYLAMARNYKNNNDHKNASSFFKNAIRLDKNNTQALTEYGVLQSERQNFQSAINIFKRVVKLLPKKAAAHSNLGVAYENSGNVSFAAEPHKKALALEPGNVSYILNYVHILVLFGEFTKAEKLLAPILNNDSHNIKAVVEQFKIYTNTNRFEKALDIVAPFIEGDIKDIPPVLMTCYLEACKNTPHIEKAVQLAEDFIASSTAKEGDIYGLLFQLGAYYDKAGNYDKAYMFYERGNKIRDERDDIYEKQLITIRHNLSGLSKSIYSQAPSSNEMTETPVFIVGMPRSGTSLVEQILDRHPDIYGIGENDLINHFLLEYIQDKPHLKRFTDCLAAFTQEDLYKIACNYLNAITAETDGQSYKRIINKMPDNFRHIPFIKMLFPNARIIHCKRNPLDTCLSIYFQTFSGLHYYAYDQTKLARYYNTYQELMNHYTNNLHIEVLNIQYEDLVADQESWSKQLVDYCGLEWNESCLDFYNSNRHVRTASKDQVNKPIYRSSIERWKHYEKHLGPLLETLNLS